MRVHARELPPTKTTSPGGVIKIEDILKTGGAKVRGHALA